MRKIVEERPTLSRNGKFHAILATKNIPEAIEYYYLFKEHYPEYNVTAIYDDTIDNRGNGEYKEDAILEMLDDYNNKFGTTFQQSTYDKYKKDVARRLAHKAPYQHLPKEKQLDLLIVVSQMLTGYDSKWVNTLYVDKLMKYVDVIQSFSRTNRLFGPEKPFGIIKYFTSPERMEQNIEEAFNLYVDQPLSVFTDKLEANLEHINQNFIAIDALFTAEGIEYYATLPRAEASKRKFAKEFCEMTKHLEASKMQGFLWDKLEYEFQHTTGWTKVKLLIDEQTYKVLLQRYRELFKSNGSAEGDEDVYHLEAYITETGAGTIDAEYINSKFIKFVKNLYTSGAGSELAKAAQRELHNAFASLSQRDQRTAQRILHDIGSGDLRLSKDKTIYDYILDYQKRECDKQVFTLAEATGLDLYSLKDLVGNDITEENINEHGRFDDLINTRDRDKCADFLKKLTGKEVARRYVIINISKAVRRFILDPAERAKIIYAYQTDGKYYDFDNPNEDVPEEVGDTTSLSASDADNKLSDEEKRKNVVELVSADLAQFPKLPPTDEIVDGFFKMLNLRSLNHLDGLAFDMYKVFDELFARKKVSFVDKHCDLSTLLTKFEVFLKKVYYLCNGTEVPPKPGETKVTLGNCIYQFPCLNELKGLQRIKYRTMSGYLADLREGRNTQAGNGAHYSMYLTEDKLDEKIKSVVTLYMYVAGNYLNDLKGKYDI